MTPLELRKKLRETDFRLTPLEFFALVNSNPDTIKEILLESNNAVYTLVTNDGGKINVEIVEEAPIKTLGLKKDSN